MPPLKYNEAWGKLFPGTGNDNYVFQKYSGIELKIFYLIRW